MVIQQDLNRVNMTTVQNFENRKAVTSCITIIDVEGLKFIDAMKEIEYHRNLGCHSKIYKIWR